MAIFNYIAVDVNGTRRTGVVDARSTNSAVSLLREQGYHVISLTEKRESVLNEIDLFSRVPYSDVVAFTRQLSTMISAGLSISKALDVLSQQSTNKKFKHSLSGVLRDVEGGASLANAFGRYPDIFSTTYQALVRAGEASGKLDEILSRLAQNMEEERELRSKFKGAMIYPAIVLVAMVGVFIILMIFVIPKLAQMYESLNVELPSMTQFMINMSNFMASNVLIVLLALVGGVIGGRLFWKSAIAFELRAKYAFVVPIFGKINKKKELTEFTRTLGLLVSSAVPIVEALNIVGDVVSSKAFKDGSHNAAVHIEKGGTLSNYLKSDKNFPPILGNMVATGEETGKLDEVLSRLSEFFANETNHAVAGLSAALEPVILILLGGMVGFLIISIITPIYKITSAL